MAARRKKTQTDQDNLDQLKPLLEDLGAGASHTGETTKDDTTPVLQRTAIPDSGEVAVTAPLHENRKALALQLTEEIKRDYYSAIRKLGRMHAERLWQELGYSTFEEYILIEFGKTRKWGYDELTRLKAVECLEAKGVTNPLQSLSKEAALVFRKWENCPEVFVLAYQQVVERGEQPTQERLDEECKVQNGYLQETRHTPDLTQEEYREYLKLHALPYTFRLDKDFQTATDLLEACFSLKSRPPLKAITQVARGDDLIALVQQLEPLGAEVAKLKELRERKADLEKQKRDKVKELSEELHKVEDEIAKAEGKGDDQDVADEEDEEDTTSDTATADTSATSSGPKPDDPLLADLNADPTAFIEDAIVRLEFAASHADLLRTVREHMPALLTRTSAALERIRCSLEADPTPAAAQNATPEPATVESVEA